MIARLLLRYGLRQTAVATIKQSATKERNNLTIIVMNPTDFEGGVEEIMGKSVQFFRVIGQEIDNQFEPAIFWLQTSDKVWHRFFINAYTLNWDFFKNDNHKAVFDEDFNVPEDEVEIDLMAALKLEGLLILNAEMNYLDVENEFCGELSIILENNCLVKVQDFNNEYRQRLLVNETVFNE